MQDTRTGRGLSAVQSDDTPFTADELYRKYLERYPTRLSDIAYIIEVRRSIS